MKLTEDEKELINLIRLYKQLKHERIAFQLEFLIDQLLEKLMKD